MLALVDFIATLFSFPFSSLLSDCTDPSTLVLGAGLVRYKKDKQPAEMCLQIWLVSLISKMFFFYLYINNNKKYKYYLILFRHWKLFFFFFSVPSCEESCAQNWQWFSFSFVLTFNCFISYNNPRGYFIYIAGMGSGNQSCGNISSKQWIYN